MNQTLSKLKTHLKSVPWRRNPFEDIAISPKNLESSLSSRDEKPDEFFWAKFPRFVPDGFYNMLCSDYPDISLFDKHVGISRGPQRPHDRYYLALNWGPYAAKRRTLFPKGVIKKRNLHKSWRHFINQLEGVEYRSFVSDILQTSNFQLRFAWHMGFSGAEVSPHVDAPSKLGTQIFYFNREGEWDPAWGGQTVLLGGLQKHIENPEFEDFSYANNASNIGNTSLVWRNSPLAWHGVRPLEAPEGHYRKIFTVIFDSI